MRELMKSRQEVVKFITNQFNMPDFQMHRKDCRHHYGVVDLRDLLDYLYGGEPLSESEELKVGGCYGERS